MYEITYRFSNTLESIYEGVQFRKSSWDFYLYRYEAKVSEEVHSQKICLILSVYLISVDSCSYSNNWISQWIESIYMDILFYGLFFIFYLSITDILRILGFIQCLYVFFIRTSKTLMRLNVLSFKVFSLK